MSRLKIRGTEVAISQIGFGCARVYGGHETKASARLIEAALTAGIRHFDTAPSYGFGESEFVLRASYWLAYPTSPSALRSAFRGPIVRWRSDL